ncbi:aldehyde dehydrogenase family protein [Streptomyces doebereineriae]|uniref:Aldehyde dehydrogenase family protein n=1 Tax=Streptomyces doebereineriae TaxID=3075528 RepID=A0ABU2VL90_9ACTN|nr:aldehyde dehydrogenase family protein [Streptomyces sp. DSM 41640]MDT0485934.1 aldehyde dehydrogenase family protein [Streptomyces sp. DSM 41640]
MTSQHHDTLLLDGWVSPAIPSRRIEVVSPVTERIIGSVPEATETDVDRAVAAARRAVDAPGGWASLLPELRAAALERLADSLTTSKPWNPASRASGAAASSGATSPVAWADAPATTTRSRSAGMGRRARHDDEEQIRAFWREWQWRMNGVKPCPSPWTRPGWRRSPAATWRTSSTARPS